MALPADDSHRQIRRETTELERRREADALVIAQADFISSALRDLRTNDRFVERVRDTFREHG